MKSLKVIFTLALLTIGLSTQNVSAQNSKGTIAFTKSKIIQASADDVWERLRALDGLEDIVPNFLSDSWVVNDAKPGVGAKRSCTAPGTPKGQASYTEQVVDFDDEKRFYSYTVVEGIPAKNMLNAFKVVDLGYKKCMVIWTSKGGEYIKNPNMTKDQFTGFVSSAGDAILAGLYKLHNNK